MAGWRDSQVAAGLAPATVNNHLASLSGFLAWVGALGTMAILSGRRPALRPRVAAPQGHSGALTPGVLTPG